MQQTRRQMMAAQKQHAIARCKQRYGIELDDETYGKMNLMVKTGMAKRLQKKSLTRGIYLLRLYNLEFVVGYDNHHGQICTFMPQHEGIMTLVKRRRGAY